MGLADDSLEVIVGGDEKIEPCPPTTRSRAELAATLQKEMHDDRPEPVRDDTELHELRARVERLKLENFALMRDEKAMRETKAAAVNRSSELLEGIREGRRIARSLLSAIAAGHSSGERVTYHELEEWVNKHP